MQGGNAWLFSLCRDLYHCKPVILLGDESEEEQKHYIELTLKAEWPEGHTTPRPSDLAYKRPKVRCDSREIAHKVRGARSYLLFPYLLRLVMCLPKDTRAVQEACLPLPAQLLRTRYAPSAFPVQKSVIFVFIT